MDNFDYDRSLEQINEHLNREISDDMLERIIKNQQQYNFRDTSDLTKDNTARKCYGMKDIATMTEKIECQGNVTEYKKSTKMPAEKPPSRKQIAEERKEKQMANKMYKPGECIKHMMVELHPTLSSAWYMADVAQELAATGARICASPSLCSPALVMWSRELAPTLAAESGLVQLASTREQCDRVLYVTTAEELSELVAAQDLARQMGHIAQLTGCKATLVVFGVQEYFKPAGRRKANSHRQQMTEVQLEMALTDLLVAVGCDTVKVDSPNDLALTIVHFTKAIAEAPYKNAKRQCDEQAQFYMRGDNKNCVTVTKNGVGAAKLWQQMLAILPMSSLERSRALCSYYASPKRLFEVTEHESLLTTEEARSIRTVPLRIGGGELQLPGGVEKLADIGVARSAVPGSLARRTGIEFARKLAVLFTADDGNALVQ